MKFSFGDYATTTVVLGLLVLHGCNGHVELKYGVDVSFPMHHPAIQDVGYNFLDGHRQEFYDNFLHGCVNHHVGHGSSCVKTEEQRIEMNVRQPQSMRNYTETGFEEMRVSDALFKTLSAFFQKNKGQESVETWDEGETYCNHWEAPTYMVSLENAKLRGDQSRIKSKIKTEVERAMQHWTGQKLNPSSQYGIRVYKSNTVLATHVDKIPSVISAIICVDEDIDEPWPIEFIGHDGKATNVTMAPGDMVLYESHSVLHGRPFPLKGRYVANYFLHFEPRGQELYDGRRNVLNDNDGLPPYIVPGSPEAQYMMKSQEQQAQTGPLRGTKILTRTALHVAADKGDLSAVKRTFWKGTPIDAVDENGWTALHEAARGGHTEVVKFLLENGAEVNIRTKHGKGDTALHLVYKYQGENTELSELLIDAGALDFLPEL